MTKQLLLTCPECSSTEVTVAHTQTFMVNTDEHYCHSVKPYDDDSPAQCLDRSCYWLGKRKDLVLLEFNEKKKSK
jgi:hypothetical protein